MRDAFAAALLVGSLTATAADAGLFFASFHSYDPIAAFEFDRIATVPALGIVYVRSAVGKRFTDIRVSIDDPNFRIVAHTCPTMLADGTSCMIFFTFDPERNPSAGLYGAGGQTAELEVSSREGASSLPISAREVGRAASGVRAD